MLGAAAAIKDLRGFWAPSFTFICEPFQEAHYYFTIHKNSSQWISCWNCWNSAFSGRLFGVGHRDLVTGFEELEPWHWQWHSAGNVRRAARFRVGLGSFKQLNVYSTEYTQTYWHTSQLTGCWFLFQFTVAVAYSNAKNTSTHLGDESSNPFWNGVKSTSLSWDPSPSSASPRQILRLVVYSTSQYLLQLYSSGSSACWNGTPKNWTSQQHPGLSADCQVGGPKGYKPQQKNAPTHHDC